MTFGPPFPDTEDVTDETYGPLKVACEVEAADRFAGRLLVIRPGYIVGPNDPTDRFTYWVRRAAAGGEMLAGAPPDAAIQGIDARDLGTFVLDRVEASGRRHVRRRRPGRAGHVGAGVRRGTPRGERRHHDRVGRRRVGPGARPGARALVPDVASAAPRVPHVRRVEGHGGGAPAPVRSRTRSPTRWRGIARAGSPALKVGMTPEKERELLDAWRASGS